VEQQYSRRHNWSGATPNDTIVHFGTKLKCPWSRKQSYLRLASSSRYRRLVVSPQNVYCNSVVEGAGAREKRRSSGVQEFKECKECRMGRIEKLKEKAPRAKSLILNLPLSMVAY